MVKALASVQKSAERSGLDPQHWMFIFVKIVNGKCWKRFQSRYRRNEEKLQVKFSENHK